MFHLQARARRSRLCVLHVHCGVVIDRLGRRGRFSLAGAGLLLAISTTPARADALVSVQLKDAQGQPAEGKVTLLDADSKPVATCEARAGKCDMPNVPGGAFTVTVQPSKGSAPKPRKVMIPPNGRVVLVVTAG